MTLLLPSLDFTLPDSSIASEPAERRGAGRDDVRLMITQRTSRSVSQDTFARIDRYLRSGDVVVVNTSATVPAAVDARTSDGDLVRVHFASPTSGGLWTVEIRTIDVAGGTSPGRPLEPQTLDLPAGARLDLLARSPQTPRLWIVAFDRPSDVVRYLQEHGRPIRYAPGPELSVDNYQTVFGFHPGSAEMPSAARPFTPDIVTRLVSKGVSVAPIVLHAGVSSYEEDESPGEERYEVPPTTATVVNAQRAAGGRVIAVGTTVVRALETVADASGVVHPGRGLTDLVVTPDRGIRAADGLLTGWHEPRSSHLRMLEAFVPRSHLQEVYDRAILEGYLWHEFGDLLLILP